MTTTILHQDDLVITTNPTGAYTTIEIDVDGLALKNGDRLIVDDVVHLYGRRTLATVPHGYGYVRPIRSLAWEALRRFVQGRW